MASSGNGKIGGMEADIRHLAQSTDKILGKLDDIGEQHTAMVMDIAVIKSTQIDSQRYMEKYQDTCDADRKNFSIGLNRMDHRMASIEEFRTEHRKKTAYIAGIVSTVMATLATTAIIGGMRVLSALAK